MSFPRPSQRGGLVLWSLFQLCWFACAASPLEAQEPPSIVGDYLGSLGPLHLKLHVTAVDPDRPTCTLDSPDQGASGLACADMLRNGAALSFTVPVVHGSWKGTISADGRTLTGTWDQGGAMPLTFTRDTFVPAAKPSVVDGFWLGTLHAGAETLRIQITIRSDQAGHEDCSLDSLDQHAMGLACANVVFAAPHFSFDVPAVKGSWSGQLAADGTKLSGTWDQGSKLPLEFIRQPGAVAAEPVKLDPALPAVSLADIESVLRNDLEHAHAFQTGVFAPGTGIGVTVGVLDHGEQRVFTYGAAKPDSVYEIGSITKTFTGLVLAQMAEQGKVKLDEPVRALLPPGTVAKPAGREITLLDLASQHSGLPRMPDNFHPADSSNPYIDYRAKDLYAFIGKHGVERAEKTEFLYSNVGLGLLGLALADRAARPYSVLLNTQITGPLGMRDTAITLSPEEQKRFLPGHDTDRHPAHAWDLDALSGAGGIRSTAGDMLLYLAAQLHPAAAQPAAQTAAKTAAAKTLPAAIAASHTLHGDSPAGEVALGWWYVPAVDVYEHGGATGGYNASAFFSPHADRAVVVLVNMAIGGRGGSAEQLAQHILQRMDGQPATALTY